MLLAVQDLNTYYGMSHVLQGISLNVNQGELVALLGRNGMGKSTTLKSIMGLVKPKSGLVVFEGKTITGYPPYKAARAGVGYVPEDRRIFPNLSVADNLFLGIKGGKILNPDDPKSANRFRFGMIADCMRPGGMASQKVRDLSAVLADWEGSQKLADLAAEVAVLAQAVAALGRERGAGA